MGSLSLNGHESKLWKVLEKENLTNLGEFHRRGFFDEVPIYSREADVAFLGRYGAAKSNEILLRFSLLFLQKVISYRKHTSAFFAAITVWDDPDDNPIVPHLFVCCGDMRRLRMLELEVPVSTFGRKIKRLICELDLPAATNVLEDTTTLADTSRVFIAPSVAPYKGFIRLEHFLKSRNPV